jgi:hypothetical protein
MSMDRANGSRTAGNTTENVIFAGPCVLFGVFPELTTTGTITIRDSATAAAVTPLHICAIGLPQAGKTFGDQRGVFLANGLTVQLSVGTDLSLIKWAPAF